MSRPRKKDKHLPPCVHEKHGAFYYVKKGKWNPIGKTLAEALENYARHVDQPRGGMPALIEKVLTYIKPSLSDNTYDQYRQAATRLNKILAEFAPDQVMTKHVAEIKVSLSDTPAMANRILSFLKVVFQHAVEWQMVDSNPCIGIKRHKEGRRERYITDEEYIAIYDHANIRLKSIMEILYLTGQRISDVLSIRCDDISESGISFTQKKTGAKLTCGMTPELQDAIQRAKALHGRKEYPFLFVSRYGRELTYGGLRDTWREAVKSAGVVDANIHDLRAKSLTDAKKQGIDATALAGHTTARQTERYIRNRQSPVVSIPKLSPALRRKIVK
ncbi:integrase [Advenella kashmirensis W13003]|uniref:Integrase n=1 Tax=Advenella kashmirensis W13003 TaxID=1424334 RepID=V8QNX8_9BURK|nr:tyrosine-type recombinase/integrase [Advenella kashmirensis]ETF00699.1 integrase [Advenella kashmirensis W13003]